MNASRVGRGFSLELLAAAALLVATVTVGSLILRELRTVQAPAAMPIEQGPVRPAAVPDQGISVPALLLDDKALRVGDDADQVSSLLGPQAQQGEDVRDRGPIGARITRAYRHSNMRFVLVLEPFETNGPLRVAAIYIQ
jgi:hypothetical protein